MVISKYLTDFTKLLFPNNCVACGEPIYGNGQAICSTCVEQFPYTLDNPFQNSLTKKIKALSPVSFVFALCYYNEGSGLRYAMKALKYRRVREVGKLFGHLLGNALQQYDHQSSCIVPVPLHPKRLRQRGYNQAQLIAQGVSEILDLPVVDYLLIRTRYNASQTKMHKIARFENVNELFIVDNRHNIEGQHVLLVDDVITTGATMLSCTETLFAQGAKAVGLASIAKASEI